MAVAEPRRILTLAGMVAVMAAVLAFVVSPAYAWQMSKTTNGVLVERDPSVDATANANISVYYDYKGGSAYDAAFNPGAVGSYRQLVTYTYAFGSSRNLVEVPLIDGGGRFQLVWCGSGYASFPVLYEPLRVSVVDTATVVVGEPVTIGSGVSIEGTATVSGDLLTEGDRETLNALFAAAVLCGIGLFTLVGYRLVRG